MSIWEFFFSIYNASHLGEMPLLPEKDIVIFHKASSANLWEEHMDSIDFRSTKKDKYGIIWCKFLENDHQFSILEGGDLACSVSMGI